MKNIQLISCAVIFSATSVHAQDSTNVVSYDFWVGKWNLSWDDGDGKIGKGTNTIVKILDGKVIQENFEATEGKFKGLKGRSLTVYNPRRKQWKQTWVDNRGGYIELTGGIKDNNLTFETSKREKDSLWSQARMVFYNITDDSLTWDWEGTTDSGKNWNLQWKINYVRAE